MKTLGLLAIARAASCVPLPGINTSAVAGLLKALGGWDPESGFARGLGVGALHSMSVCALGLSPYISAAFILQILHAMTRRRGEQTHLGALSPRFAVHIPLVTGVVCLVQGYFIVHWMEGIVVPGTNRPLVPLPGWQFRVLALLALTAGTAFFTWIAGQISRVGLANGIALLFLLQTGPSLVETSAKVWRASIGAEHVTALALGYLASVMLLLLFFRSERRVPLRRGRREGGPPDGSPPRDIELAICVGPGGGAPFALALGLLPIMRHVGLGSLTAVSIPIGLAALFLFSFLWLALFQLPTRIAQDLQSADLVLPGVEPGVATSEHLAGVLSRLTVFAFALLGLAAILPWVAASLCGRGMPASLKGPFGGSAMLLVVPLALDVMARLRAASDDRSFVTVARFGMALHAEGARLRLEAEGIDVRLVDRHLVHADWFWTYAVGGLQVQVPAPDIERARQVLAAMRATAA